MKRGAKKKPNLKKKTGIAAAVAGALTWDGARAPLGPLPAKAKTFLGIKIGTKRPPDARKLAQLFAEGSVDEIRVCWVPLLRGGDDVLCAPFSTANGKRLPFRVAKTQRFGDVLGVIYRR